MSNTIQFVTKDKGYNEIMAKLQSLRNSYVMVGLPGDSPQAKSAEGVPVPGLTVAGLGIIHEYGSSAQGIPSRPFMRQTWDRAQKNTKLLMKVSLKHVAQNKINVRQALFRLGAYYEGQVKDTIRNGSFVPNAPYTILKKKSSKPLIDTGIMRASVTFRVKEKG